MTQYIDKSALVAEIERLINNHDSALDYEAALEDMRNFINSLQEEPIFKVGDTIQKKDNNSIRYSIINKTNDGYRALRGLSDTIVIWFSEQDKWELVKEPVSEDLEEAAEEYEEKGRIDSVVSRKRDFINGAKWQKEQDKETIELAEDHAMFAGMEKMKEQMMKEAVEAKVIPADLDETQFCLSDYDEVSYITAMVKAGKLKLLDKIKVVIVKED